MVGCNLLQHSVAVMRPFFLFSFINFFLEAKVAVTAVSVPLKGEKNCKKSEGRRERLRGKQRCPFKMTLLTSSK